MDVATTRPMVLLGVAATRAIALLHVADTRALALLKTLLAVNVEARIPSVSKIVEELIQSQMFGLVSSGGL